MATMATGSHQMAGLDISMHFGLCLAEIVRLTYQFTAFIILLFQSTERSSFSFPFFFFFSFFWYCLTFPILRMREYQFITLGIR